MSPRFRVSKQEISDFMLLFRIEIAITISTKKNTYSVAIRFNYSQESKASVPMAN